MSQNTGKTKKEDMRNLIGGIISLLLFIAACAFFLWTTKRRPMETVVGINANAIHVLMVLGVACIYFAVKNRAIFIAYSAMVFGVIIWLSFADITYSAIDEIMNFENINHIVKHNNLPKFDDPADIDFINAANNGANNFQGIRNYEAVQAPLFYLTMAVFGKFLPQASVRLHTLRLISLLSVLLVYLFLHMTIVTLKKAKIIDVDWEIFRLGVLLTIFSPSYLFRASRLNNEILVCVLCAAMLALLVKCMVNGYKFKYYLGLSLLCCGCFMTKNTAIYAYIPFGVLALMQRKVPKGLIAVGIGALFILPWFAFNYVNYGSLIPMGQHVDVVLPAVSANGLSRAPFEIIFYEFSMNFYSTEEAFFAGGEIFWVHAIFLLGLCMVFYFSKDTLETLYHKRFRFEEYSQKTKLNVLCTAMLLGCLAALCAGTVVFKLVALRGRYFYPACIAMVVLMVANKDLITVKLRKYVTAILVIALAVVSIRIMVFFTDRVFARNEWFLPKQEVASALVEGTEDPVWDE